MGPAIPRMGNGLAKQRTRARRGARGRRPSCGRVAPARERRVARNRQQLAWLRKRVETSMDRVCLVRNSLCVPRRSMGSSSGATTMGIDRTSCLTVRRTRAFPDGEADARFRMSAKRMTRWPGT